MYIPIPTSTLDLSLVHAFSIWHKQSGNRFRRDYSILDSSYSLSNLACDNFPLNDFGWWGTGGEKEGEREGGCEGAGGGGGGGGGGGVMEKVEKGGEVGVGVGDGKENPAM